jgi:hypothetical protein
MVLGLINLLLGVDTCHAIFSQTLRRPGGVSSGTMWGTKFHFPFRKTACFLHRQAQWLQIGCILCFE